MVAKDVSFYVTSRIMQLRIDDYNEITAFLTPQVILTTSMAVSSFPKNRIGVDGTARISLFEVCTSWLPEILNLDIKGWDWYWH